MIDAGHDNETVRTVAFGPNDRINVPALTCMIEQIISSNRAGGRRKLEQK